MTSSKEREGRGEHSAAGQGEQRTEEAMPAPDDPRKPDSKNSKIIES